MYDTPASRRWRALVDAQDTSGLSNVEFARQVGVNPQTLACWRSQLRRPGPDLQQPTPTTSFAEITVANPAPSVVLAFDELKVHVVVDPRTDLLLLRQLVRALA